MIDYGFDKISEPEKEDDLPYRTFYIERVIDNLYNKVGEFPPFRLFADQVQWGRQFGAIRVRFIPNKNVMIERQISDSQGQPSWIVKKVLKLKTQEFIGHEDVVAKDIEKFVNEIAKEPIDSAVSEYKHIHSLAKSIGDVSYQHNYPCKSIKKINDNNYNILISFPNVGKVADSFRGNSNYTAMGVIDISYSEGLIKSIITTVDIERGGAWEIDIPYFTGQFSPSQSVSEIVDALMTGLSLI